MKKLILVASMSALCFAQTAEVNDLTTDESAEGRRLYKAMIRSQEEFSDYKTRMGLKYLSHDGFSRSVDFDAKFKHIVLTGLGIYNWSSAPITAPIVNGGGCAYLDEKGNIDATVPCSISIPIAK